MLGVLAGCAATPMGPTVPVMPGPGRTFEAFQADQSYCQYYATQQVQGQADAANQRAAGTAVLGTLLGAGLGAAVGSVGGNVGAGAAIGAAAGAAGGTAYGANSSTYAQYGIQQQYDNAFAQCMYARGNQVPGFAPRVIYNAPAASMAPYPSSALPASGDSLVWSTQSELIRLGYLRSSADGYLGPDTRSAIASFEQAYGLPVDGMPSPRLLATLQSTAPGGWNGAPATTE